MLKKNHGPYEGPLPERPTIREIVEHYRLRPHLIALAANVPFRDVEEMMIGRLVERESVETVLKMISLYMWNRHGVELELEIEEWVKYPA